MRPALLSCLAWLLAAGPAAATEITIAAGLLPPHVDENGQGREPDILRAVLTGCAGRPIRLQVAPFGRHWSEYEAKQQDAVATVPAGVPLPGFASAPYIAYQNGAAWLAGSPRPVESRANLAGRTAVTFAEGAKILGLQDIAFARLTEHTDQVVHSNLLFSRRVDLVLADGMIFAEFNRRLQARRDQPGIDPTQPVRFRAIFPPTPYHMVFRDRALMERFDACFRDLEASGRIAAINRTYVDRYRDTVGDQYLGY